VGIVNFLKPDRSGSEIENRPSSETNLGAPAVERDSR
jgi:hypothetical protein